MLAGTHHRVPASRRERRLDEINSYSCMPLEFVEDGMLCPCVGVP
jgi:hypothetical protein